MFLKKIKCIVVILFFLLANNAGAFLNGSDYDSSTKTYTTLTGDFAGADIYSATSKSSTSKQTTAAASTLEQRYGFDSNVLRRVFQSAGGPKVSINFDNSAPLEGDTVTAIALVEKYETEVAKLYFTWFLIRAEDDLTDEDTIEKAKRRAAKIMAQGKYNPEYFATDYTTNNSVDADKDYFKAPFGGGNGVGGKEGDATKYLGIGKYEEESYSDQAKRVVNSAKITRCYRHNYGYSFEEEEDGKEGTSGKDLVVECAHKFAQTDESGPESVSGFCDSGSSAEYVLGTGTSESGFTADEEACWGLDPNNPDTDGDGVFDEADLIGVGQDQFKWKYRDGDRVGLVVEGTTSVVINEEGVAETFTPLTVAAREAQCNEAKTACDTACRAAVGVDPSQTTTTGTIDPDTGEVDLSSETVSGEDPFLTQNYALCKEECVNKQEKCKNEAEAYVQSYNTQAQIVAESSAINGYKKIMWTGIDICTEDKIDLMAEDECDGSEDVGFSFLASRLVKEKANENLEAKVGIFPEKPQISTVDENSSDYVTLTAEVTNEITNDTFAYYKWEIYACGNLDLDSCLADANKITSACTENSSLGECAKIDKDGDGVAETTVLDSSSSAEGMGAKEITFRPKIDLLPEEKTYLKVLIKTKRDKNNDQYSVTEVDVPFAKSNTGIRFFKVSEISPGVFGFDENTDEICNKKAAGIDNGYSTMCPVVPYQIVAAKSAVKTGMDDSKFSYNWTVDSQPIKPINNCPFVGGCSGKVIYFPVVGEGLDRKVVTLNAKEESKNDSVAEKIYSINSPIGIIKLDTDNVNAAWQTVQSNGEGVEDLFEAVTGEEVSFRVDLVPDYFNQNGKQDVDILWILDGEEVTAGYFEKYPDSGVVLEEEGKKIYFPVPKEVGKKLSLKVSVKKSLFEDENDTAEEKAKKERERVLLEETFGLLDYRETESEDLVEIKVVEAPLTTYEKGSLKFFFASTIKNAPEYLVFSLRVAIMLILGWSLLFGFSYFLGTNKNNPFSNRKYL